MWLPNIWDMYLSPLRRPLTWPLTCPFTAPDAIIGPFLSIFAPQNLLNFFQSSMEPATNF